MDFTKIRRWLAPPPSPDDLYPAALMRRILERERARADRTRIPLSVITFRMDGQNSEPGIAASLGKILRSRLRTLDETGWLDEVRICAVLPATPPQGAWKV